MGSPISSIVASLFMEEFEIKAINSTPHPPRLWLRYVDDTFFIQRVENSNQFMKQINSIDPHIQFTMETAVPQGSIPFQDTLVSTGPDTTLLTTGFRKPTHTDQYVYWDNHHNLSAKYRMFHTLTFSTPICSLRRINAS